MAAIEDWKKWSCNFYHGEELRSLYMNGILLEGFRPGIYNPNILLYENNGHPAICIKRGTQFLFSNNYTNESGLAERYFYGLGKTSFGDGDDQFSYLLKYTANNDFYASSIDSVTLNDLASVGTSYLFACSSYGAKTAADSSSLVSFHFYKEADVSSDRRYANITSESIAVPYDGLAWSSFTSTSNALKPSYLCVGILKYIGPASFTNVKIEDFVFTGHGLPEYRQAYTSNLNVYTPDIAISSDLKSLRIDYPAITFDDVLYSKKETNFAFIETKKTSQVDDIKISEISSTADKTTVDFYYLSTTKNLSNTNLNDFEDILNTGTSNLKLNCASWTLNSTAKSEIEQVGHMVGYSLNPGMDFETTASTPSTTCYGHALYDLISSEISSKFALPLDISAGNIKRLTNLIENKNIIPYFIDNIRQNNLGDYTSIVPVALIFRKMRDGKFVDTVSTTNSFNPANILSFFDLQFKGMRACPIVIKNSEVYKTLAVIN